MATTNSKATRRLAFGGAAIAASLLAAAAVLYGCAEADSVVLVRVNGDVARILQLAVRASVGEKVSELRVRDSDSEIPLPTSFSLQIPSNLDGAFRITVTALNVDGKKVGEGEAMATNTPSTINVTLVPVPPGDDGPKRDAGSSNGDAAPPGNADAGRDSGSDAQPMDAPAMDAPVVVDAQPDAAAMPDVASAVPDAAGEEGSDPASPQPNRASGPSLER